MWEDTFRHRMEKFGNTYSVNPDGVALSIKVRVISGCFHREHSPHAYKIIDNYIQNDITETNFEFVEHESGPEILVYLALASSLVTLSGSIIDLINTIIKARSESVKKGDRPNAPIELIIRRVKKSGDIVEERILRINHDDIIEAKEIQKKLETATKKLLSDGKNKKRARSTK